MSKNKDPAVLFYTADFLADTTLWNYDELGRYIKLLCLQHLQGGISEDDFKSVAEASNRVNSKFDLCDDGLYRNKRMQKEAESRHSFCESRRANINKRYEKANSTSAPTYVEHKKSICDTSVVHMENENINVNEIKNVIEYLNSKLGTKYRYSTASIQKHIKARISEGATFEDFRTVIDKKYDEWMGTEFAKFLRPETLFGSKFHQYLNQIPSTPIKPKQTMARCGDFDAEEAFRLALERSNKED